MPPAERRELFQEQVWGGPPIVGQTERLKPQQGAMFIVALVKGMEKRTHMVGLPGSLPSRRTPFPKFAQTAPSTKPLQAEGTRVRPPKFVAEAWRPGQ
jgi:hypothetical protein